ncbi:hypothetical protein U9M48_037656 [Paspalum notatum var. saurae]|uniref:VQ domain-containing protein n=1 Tax=Paspalum notatum var. saurae TaxID=547442 RepID=A0AAQ3UJT2_PASNO
MEVQPLQAELMRRPEAALRAVQKPPAKPWRGGAGGLSAAQQQPPPPPPKVYRVEPREFRDLVQRLTGAPPSATRRHHMPAAAAPPVQPVPVRAAASEHHHHPQQQLYGSSPSWFSFPLAGVDGGSSTGGLM